MNKIFTLVFISIIFFSCSSTKQSYEDYKGDSIVIGFGGGFSGLYKEYVLHKNGNIYINNLTDKKVSKIGYLPKNTSLQIFKNIEVLGLTGIHKNDPGNMNRYLVFDIDGEKNKILWANNADDIGTLNTFFQILMNEIKKLNK